MRHVAVFQEQVVVRRELDAGHVAHESRNERLRLGTDKVLIHEIERTARIQKPKRFEYASNNNVNLLVKRSHSNAHSNADSITL